MDATPTTMENQLDPTGLSVGMAYPPNCASRSQRGGDPRLAATNSVAYLRSWSTSSSPQRASIRTLRPTLQPNSCRPWWNAEIRSSPSGLSAARFMSKPMRRRRSVCCARAASGQAAAAPPSATSNSRRPMSRRCQPRRDEREPRTGISQLELQLYGLRDAARRSLHQLRRECRGADLGVRPRRYCRRAVFGRLPRGAPAVLLHAARALARAATVLGSRLAGPIFTFGSPMSWPLSVCTVVPTV